MNNIISTSAGSELIAALGYSVYYLFFAILLITILVILYWYFYLRKKSE
jgi:hypothetical protein